MPGPSFTFAESLSANVAKPLKRRGADWPSREPRSANGSLAAEIGQGHRSRSGATLHRRVTARSETTRSVSKCLTNEGQGATGDAEPFVDAAAATQMRRAPQGALFSVRKRGVRYPFFKRR